MTSSFDPQIELKNKIYVTCSVSGNGFNLSEFLTEYKKDWDEPLQDYPAQFGYEDVLAMLKAYNDVIEVVEYEQDKKEPKVFPIYKSHWYSSSTNKSS
uniref:Uncharacterized protein n=1 Tax=Acrobeloides nanus TaxID=290746 RepID=A0A914D2X7_9BILA